MTLEHPPVPGKLPGELPKRQVSRRGFLKIAAGVGAAAGLAAVGGIAIPMISSDGEGANPDPNTQPLAGGEGTPTPNTDPTASPSASPSTTPEVTKTPEVVVDPRLLRTPADRFGFKVGTSGVLNDINAITASGEGKKIFSHFNRLYVPAFTLVNIAPQRDSNGIHYDFSRPKAFAKIADKYDMDMTAQISFGTSRPDTNPDWVNKIKTPEEAGEIIKDVATTTVTQNPNIKIWIINEPYAGPQRATGRRDIWQDVRGNDYPFLFARAVKSVNPNTLVFLNDNNNEKINNVSDANYKLAEQMVAEGILDGIGFQMHQGLGPGNLPTADEVARNMERFAKLKKGEFKLTVTEFDINLQNTSVPGNTQEEKWKFQAEQGGSMLNTLLKMGGEGFVAFGLNDSHSWLTDQGFPQAQGTFFDTQSNEKPIVAEFNRILTEEAQRRGK